MPATLVKTEDALELSLAGCRGAEFGDALDKIREVPGRAWDPDNKVWRVPLDARAADRILKTIHPEVDSAIEDWVRESMLRKEESLTTPLPDDAKSLRLPWAYKRLSHQPEYVNDVEFKGALPHQRAAIEAMARDGRAVLADDMGLGKTLEAIGAIEEWQLANGQADGPKLVITLDSVKGGWVRELNRWLDKPDVVVLKGSYAPRNAQPGECELLGIEPVKKLTPEQVKRVILLSAIERNAWIIINWEQLVLVKEKVKKKTRIGGTKTVVVRHLKEPLFEETEWLAVIGDEAHMIKNPDAARTKGTWRVQGQVMYALTGTPVMNSPDELWSLLRWLWPDQYHERGGAHKEGAVAYGPFYQDYVEFYEDHRGRKFITGVKNPDALKFVLKKKLIRRTSSLLGLKGKKRIFIDDLELNPGQQKLYDEALAAMWLHVTEDATAGNKQALEFARAAIEAGDVASLIRIPNGAARLVRLQQILENCALVGGPDDSALMDRFETLYEQSGTGAQPWMVYTKFKASCDILAERMRKKYGARVAVYTGDVSPTDRTAIEDQFQRGELDIVVGTMKAMGTGITMTRSHLMYFLTRDWVPAVNSQCEDRENRLGQKEQVLVYIAHPLNTVAADKVTPKNTLKQQIESIVLPQDKIEEVRA